MGEITGIGWTMHTGSPHLGCTKVSDECTNCYAWKLARGRMERLFREAYRKAGIGNWETCAVWGDKAVRVVTKGFWKEAYRLNNKAARAGQPELWFPSLMDWLDEMPAGVIDQDGNWLTRTKVLADFLRVVMETEWLVWQLLTKRPENWRSALEVVVVYLLRGKPEGYEELVHWISEWLDGRPPVNVWLGVTCGVEAAYGRMTKLKELPAVVRFVSVEPLLEDLELLIDGELSGWACRECGSFNVDTDVRTEEGTGYQCGDCQYFGDGEEAAWKPLIHLFIIGCESNGERVGRESWVYPQRALKLIRECQAAGVKCFHKQMPVNGRVSTTMKEWPAEFQVQEMPPVVPPVAAE